MYKMRLGTMYVFADSFEIDRDALGRDIDHQNPVGMTKFVAPGFIRGMRVAIKYQNPVGMADLSEIWVVPTELNPSLSISNPPIEIGGYNMLHPYGILNSVNRLKIRCFFILTKKSPG